MKQVFASLLATVLLTGCAHRYDMTLVDGLTITRVTKPKLNKDTGMYEYTDIRGNTKFVGAFRVVEISPDKAPAKGRQPQKQQ